MANDRDQMCLDCHRVRNTTDHTKGTHPVNFNYTSASSLVKIIPNLYVNPPLNSNPGNPTSAMKLNNGAVLCTTCHAVVSVSRPSDLRQSRLAYLGACQGASPYI